MLSPSTLIDVQILFVVAFGSSIPSECSRSRGISRRFYVSQLVT